MDFHILQNATLPYLIVEITMKDSYEFEIFQNYIDNLYITVSMKNLHTSKIIINNKSADLYYKDNKYYIRYKWQSKDTKNIGEYSFEFQLRFNSDNYKKVIKLPRKDTLKVHIHNSFVKSEIV